jgi:hypothetical protein
MFPRANVSRGLAGALSPIVFSVLSLPGDTEADCPPVNRYSYRAIQSNLSPEMCVPRAS